MSTTINFNSGFNVAASIPARYSDLEVEAEPMLFQADLEFAWAKGGPITRTVIEALPLRFRNEPVIIDTRVHMLMPGWVPCIPGWHLDDIPRTQPDGQPDHVNPAYRAEHAMMITNDCSATAFAVGQFSLVDRPVGAGVVYDGWHRDVTALVDAGKVQEVLVKPYEIVTFNDQSFHRGTEATRNGWRYFMRVTRQTHRQPVNKIRRQTNVYMPTPNAGW